jgi:hypothetical protein
VTGQSGQAEAAAGKPIGSDIDGTDYLFRGLVREEYRAVLSRSCSVMPDHRMVVVVERCPRFSNDTSVCCHLCQPTTIAIDTRLYAT